MLLERFSRQARERRRAESERRAQAANPLHRLVTMLLEQAVEMKADALAFGFRGDDQNARDHLPGPDANSDSDIAQAVADAVGPVDPRLQAASHATPRLRGPYGLRIMPVWVLFGDRFEQLVPIPIQIYAALLAEFEDRLVSLDGTPSAPQPRKFIELRPREEGRRLVEVALEWTLHDAFVVRILSHQAVPPGARVSPGFY